MDSLTHLAMGHAMGVLATGASPAVQAGAYWGALVGNSLPDIDVPVGYLLGRGWGFHRKFTHTIPGVLILSALATGLITLAIPGSNPLITLGWTLAGCVVHVFVDCLNLFGTRPFWPFSNQKMGLGILFIMDPLILAALGLGGIGHLAGWVGTGVLQALYGAVWVYIAARWLVHGVLKRKLAGPGVIRASLVPWFMFWRYFRETESAVEYGTARALTGTLTPIEQVRTARGPVVDASRQLPQVAAFLDQARYPFAWVEQQGELYRVVWQDLYLRLRGWKHSVEVTLDHELRPVE